MKPFFAGLVILPLLVLTFACAALMDSGMIGKAISTIVEQWGRPTSVTPDGIGGYI